MDMDIPAPVPNEVGRTTSSEASAAVQKNRMDRIEEYREQSLRKSDPLAANLGLISSDLMLFAQGNAELVSPPSLEEASPEALQRFERQANLQLRLVRQIDRLARIDQELEKGEGSKANGNTEAKN